MAQENVRSSLKEYGRGILGGILFSLPLLYTMEVWWTGFTANPTYLFFAVVVTFVLLLAYNRFAGMRPDATFKGVVWDSVEEMGLALVVAFLFLLVIGRIHFGMSTLEILGKVIVESMIVAIGISVGTAQLGGQKKESTGMEGEGKADENKNNLWKIFMMAICGAFLFASSVAPTEEILLIAVGVSSIHLIFMVLISLALCTVVLFFIDFHNGSTQRGAFFISRDVVVSYIAALLVSFTFLWFFGRVQNYSFNIIISQLIVLGIPASLGASAGRLLIGK